MRRKALSTLLIVFGLAMVVGASLFYIYTQTGQLISLSDPIKVSDWEILQLYRGEDDYSNLTVTNLADMDLYVAVNFTLPSSWSLIGSTVNGSAYTIGNFVTLPMGEKINFLFHIENLNGTSGQTYSFPITTTVKDEL